MKTIKVNINSILGEISVMNDGKGIPVRKHQKEKELWVPELIFGSLLTSSNYDDNVKKTTGGRNGYGAKLTNIYSTEFTVETFDSERKLHYLQTWRNNMSDKTDAQVKHRDGSGDFTKITFKPDLKRFKLDKLDADHVAIFTKRAYDMAGVIDKRVTVYLNDTKIPIANFEEYIKLYMDTEENKELPFIHYKCTHWEVVCTHSDG